MSVNMCGENTLSYHKKINKQNDSLSHELNQILRENPPRKKNTKDIHQWKTLALRDEYGRFYFLCFQARAV